MVRTPRDVTEAELAVLKQLWEHGRMTARQLTDALYDGSESDYATVKKLLSRLEHKGCVTRHRQAPAHLFSPALTQDELLGRRLQVLADNLCDGSRTPLLLHLLRTESLSQAERDELRQLVDELSSGTERPKKKTKPSSRKGRS